MKDASNARTVYWVLATVAGAQLFWLAAVLPDTVASHFDASGAADGWMDRGSFLLLMAGVEVLSCGVFALIARVMPRIPASMISLPNAEYWLAPERRERSIDRIAAWMYHVGSATWLFMLAVMQYIYWRNATGAEGSDPWFWVVLLLYLAVMGGVLVLMFREFGSPVKRRESGRT